MIKRLRVLPAAVGLSLIFGCGSPTAPDIPGPDDSDDPDDPKTGMIDFQPFDPGTGIYLG